MLLFRSSISLCRIDKSKLICRSISGTKRLNADEDESATNKKSDDTKRDPMKSEDVKRKEAKVKLDLLLESMNKESINSNSKSKIQLATPNLKRKENPSRNSIEPGILKAVEKVVDTYTPNLREEKKNSLISKLEAVAKETVENKVSSHQKNKLSELLGSMKTDGQTSNEEKVKYVMPNLKESDQPKRDRGVRADKKKSNAPKTAKKESSVVPNEDNMEPESFKMNKETTDHLNTLLNTLTVDTSGSKKRIRTSSKTDHQKVERAFSAEPLGLFKNAKFESPSAVTKLAIWDRLYEKELMLTVTHPPANGFQEMIQWTKQGKMWLFPINNEQGLEKEAEIGFHEHVFLEPHLDPWCPRRGPIRHFMELVVVGLSKNPYVTLDAKIGHIKWFRDFFDEHRTILVESGAIETASSPPRVSA